MVALNKQRSWERFEGWCRAHGLSAAPAHPWTVAAYVRSTEKTMRMDALRRHIGHIGRAHYERLRTRPDRHPIVKRTLESIRRKADRDVPPPLFIAEDFIAPTTVGATPAQKRKGKAAPKAKAKGKGLRASPPLVRRKRV